jgi:hypothetical protein
MTGSNGKRQLPSIPHPDHLRKQAKARLAAMRAKMPTARLAEAQGVIAREYGFASWAALQAEVASRVQSPRGQWRKVNQAHVAPLYPERFRQDGLLDDEANIQTNLRFFMAGAAAQIGFLFAALVGLALLFITPAQTNLAHAALIWLGGAR